MTRRLPLLFLLLLAAPARLTKEARAALKRLPQ
jgi:hypothetical protein